MTATSRPGLLLTPTETAELLGTTVDVLKKWRYEKRGPQWTPVGRRIMYARSDVMAWLSASRRGVARRVTTGRRPITTRRP